MLLQKEIILKARARRFHFTGRVRLLKYGHLRSMLSIIKTNGMDDHAERKPSVFADSTCPLSVHISRMRAELGSAFLCAQFEIKQQGRDDHARYIKSWLQALKNDRSLSSKYPLRRKKQ